MDELENEQRLTKVEESVKSAHHRINNVESMQREIRELALSVNTLANNFVHMSEDVAKVCGRVTEIESKPGKRLDQIIGFILSALVIGLVGYALGKLL